MMKTIKDCLYGHIEIETYIQDLLDTPEVQRLRRIKQLGSTALVYPSANHTRFEHSLGVYHLAKKVSSQLGIEPKAERHISAAALLHDVGHTPFSHDIEPVIERQLNKGHEEVGDIIMDGELGSVFEQNDLDPNRICSLIRGEGKYGQIISGAIDVDRMDYLSRDAYHTGVPYGTIDQEHIIRNLDFIDSNLVLEEGAQQAAESVLISRSEMYPTVYHHHTSRIGELMIRRATERVINNSKISARDVWRMDDPELISILRENPVSQEIISRVDNRNLFKRALWLEMTKIPKDLLDLDATSISEKEQVIANQAGIKKEEVILDVPERPSIPESSMKIKSSGGMYKLENKSTIASQLKNIHHDHWRFGIYTPPDSITEVRESANQVLGLDTIDTNIEERHQGESVK